MTIFSVSEFIQFLNDALVSIAPYNDLAIEGEVADFKISQGKWIWFDLKDESGVVTCFMTMWNLKTPLEDGMKVRVFGYPKIYQKSGKFSFTVNKVELLGEGTLKKAYDLLKKKLEVEGLFAQERKRAIPRFPSRIALITSPGAAAYTDFLKILNNRWGGVEVDLIPVTVQGASAVVEIISAFKWLNTHEEDYDVCVLTRGGGSMEDLQPFNSEDVARAVYGAKVPVICGIGHERDECLAEFVADVRASTPSNAAERAVPSRTEIVSELNFIIEQMEGNLNYKISNASHEVDRIFSLIERQARAPLIKCQELFGNFKHRFESFFFQLENYDNGLNNFQKMLVNLDPARLLSRGYSIARGKRGIIRRAEDVAIGEEIVVELGKGKLEAQVNKKF